MKKSRKGESIIGEESFFKNFKNLPPTFLLLTLTFALGAMSSFFALYIIKLFSARNRAKNHTFNGHEALQILYPHIGESAEVEFIVRQLYAIKNGEKKVKLDKELLKKLLKRYKPKEQ